MSLSVASAKGRARAQFLGSPLRLVAAALLLSVTVGPVALGEEPVVRVEEDWMLILNEPDNSVDSPQFHTVMSPFGNMDSYYAQVVWNYREIPWFIPGGLQLESWNGEQLVRTRSVRETQLSTVAETITWTQSLETDGVVLLFQILNGQSTTWGLFGNDMSISTDAFLPDLATYDVNISTSNSCITYGANRVNLLFIRQVRYFNRVGDLVSVDSSPRLVYLASSSQE